VDVDSASWTARSQETWRRPLAKVRLPVQSTVRIEIMVHLSTTKQIN